MGSNQSSFLRRQGIAADIADALIISTALRDDAGKFHAALLHHSAGIGVMGIVVRYQQFLPTSSNIKASTASKASDMMPLRHHFLPMQ